jgi:hypothetical protein
MDPGYVEEDRVDRLHLLGAHRPRLEHRSVQGDSQGRRAGSLFVIAGVDLTPITAPVMAHTAGASPPVRWLRSGDGVKLTPVLDRRSSLSCDDLERQQRPTSRDPEPHERDRLKDVGRRGRGKTVKVAKNDEDGTARGGIPRRGTCIGHSEPSMTCSSTARWVDPGAPECWVTQGRVSRVAHAVTRSRRCLVGTPTTTAQEVEVEMDSFQQPRPSALQWPAAATATKVNTG